MPLFSLRTNSLSMYWPSCAASLWIHVLSKSRANQCIFRVYKIRTHVIACAVYMLIFLGEIIYIYRGNDECLTKLRVGEDEEEGLCGGRGDSGDPGLHCVAIQGGLRPRPQPVRLHLLPLGSCIALPDAICYPWKVRARTTFFFLKRDCGGDPQSRVFWYDAKTLSFPIKSFFMCWICRRNAPPISFRLLAKMFLYALVGYIYVGQNNFAISAG